MLSVRKKFVKVRVCDLFIWLGFFFLVEFIAGIAVMG